MPPRITHRIIDDIECKVCKGPLCKNDETPDGIWKSLDNFGIDNQTWDKLKAICKECKNINERIGYSKNPKPRMTEEELKAAKIKKYVDPYIKIIDEKTSKRCATCEEWLPLENFATEGNKKYITGEQKRRYECRNCRNTKRAERKRTDPDYKLKENLRVRVYQALKDLVKSSRTMELVGCTIDKLWTYLEEQFEEGMTRENYGPVWHVDHIIPCNAFDLTKESEQRRCFNYRNLQPMFASANISKGDTYKFDIVKEIELHSAISKPT